MYTLHKETDVLERIVSECEEDYVGLWSIYRRVKEAGFSDPMHWTSALIQFLLLTGVIEAGVPDDKGHFNVWTLSPNDAYNRIMNEWLKLGREPDIGDIVWFTTPVRTI